MSAYGGVLRPETPAYRILDSVLRESRIVATCGIPGAGKSLLMREQVLIARTLGRRVHRLQWDVARQAFEQPAILARYPEIGGSTHPVIRRAAGLWLRDALFRWCEEHVGDEHLLLIEAPLVGGRFIELARVEADAVEPILALPTTRFLVPQPSREVRAAIEAARAAEIEHPRHARDAANAVPALVDELWQAVLQAAEALAIPFDKRTQGYSPELYFALYQRLLHHRHVAAVPVTDIFPDRGSPHSLKGEEVDLVPTTDSAANLIRAVETGGVEQAIRSAEHWYEVE
jgi:hypothetical protein